ncbi:Uncharacterised protein [Serratia grimesii]|nr:Uncharacterised protein [Serratia grimesii]
MFVPLLQLLAVSGDHSLIPAKALLFLACQIIVVIDVHKAVLFLVAVEPREQIDKRPRVVAAHIGPLFDRRTDRLNMIAQVVNPRLIAYLSLDDWIFGTQSVLGNVDRDVAIAFDDTPNGIGQPLRLHFPVPIGVNTVRVAHQFEQPFETQLAPAAFLATGVDGITVHVDVMRYHFTLVIIQPDKIYDVLL